MMFSFGLRLPSNICVLLFLIYFTNPPLAWKHSKRNNLHYFLFLTSLRQFCCMNFLKIKPKRYNLNFSLNCFHKTDFTYITYYYFHHCTLHSLIQKISVHTDHAFCFSLFFLIFLFLPRRQQLAGCFTVNEKDKIIGIFTVEWGKIYGITKRNMANWCLQISQYLLSVLLTIGQVFWPRSFLVLSHFSMQREQYCTVLPLQHLASTFH